MNKFFKTASIISAGILVGVVARKISRSSAHSAKPTNPNSLDRMKIVYDTNTVSEDVNNYFV